MLPDVTVHGVWVRSQVHDGFGRICYKVLNRVHNGSVEFFIVWNPDADLGTREPTAGYHDPETLEVRPYKPKPWFKGPLVKEVVYENDNEPASEQGVRPEGALAFGEAARVLREGRWPPRASHSPNE